MVGMILEWPSSPGPHSSLGAHAETYARVIGSWHGELKNSLGGQTDSPVGVEIDFAWALAGPAVQDVWISPTREERARGTVACLPMLDWYGTTIRLFDVKTQTWRATWCNAMTGGRIDLEGTRQGDDIVQIGVRQGRPIRWTFTDIRADSFVWRAHVLELDGDTWRLEVEIRAHRSNTRVDV